MTKSEMTKIAILQKQGLGYRRIAAELGLSPNTLKVYCKNHPVKAEDHSDNCCKHCGNPLNKHHPSKKFCNDQCRMAWWNSHRVLVQKKAFHNLTCEVCGKPFTVYGKPKQRFCSRDCYYSHRRKVVAP